MSRSCKNLVLTIALAVVSFAAYSQKPIKGIVIDSISFSPLPGVNLQIKNTSRGTTTDGKGEFRILEPLLNYANVIAAIEKITSPQGLNMAARRLTVSTVGIAKMIVRMADDAVKFNLAVSLHSAIPGTRSSIMPINDTNSLKELGEALKYWYQKIGKKVTYEYVVWEGINDSPEDATALLDFCKLIPCKVNLIEYNPIEEDGDFHQAGDDKLQMYQHLLESNGITTRIRKSRGKDIDAACGQLANKG